MINYKKGLKLDGKNPTILYSYGGFNISLQPAFSVVNAIWMENGGIYAVPNIRGGGEYGKKWHDAGTKMQKKNVFDDFFSQPAKPIKKEVQKAPVEKTQTTNIQKEVKTPIKENVEKKSQMKKYLKKFKCLIITKHLLIQNIQSILS